MSTQFIPHSISKMLLGQINLNYVSGPAVLAQVSQQKRASTFQPQTQYRHADSSAPEENGPFKETSTSIHHGLCPLCGVTKSLKSTANYRAIFVASHSDRDTVPIFECQGINKVTSCFRICGTCGNVVRAAIRLLATTSATWKYFLNSIIPKRGARREAVFVRAVLKSQGKPLIEIFRSLRENPRETSRSRPLEATSKQGKFNVGDKIFVLRHMRSSQPEDGGVGEVLSIEVRSIASMLSASYSIRYDVDHRIETNLSESLITCYSYAQQHKRCRQDKSEETSSTYTKAGNSPTNKFMKGFDNSQDRLRYLEAEVLRSSKLWKINHAGNNDAAE